MTAPDVRTAAQEEAERRHRLNPDHMRARVFFTEGAVWGAALVTPTREQIAEALYSNHPRAETRSWADTPRLTREICLEDADAVLALMQGLAGDGR